VITPPVEDGDPLEDCPEIRLAPGIRAHQQRPWRRVRQIMHPAAATYQLSAGDRYAAAKGVLSDG
jgi:hypothetical protein